MLNKVNIPGNITREMTSIFLALNWKLWTHSIIRFLLLITGASLRSKAPAGIIGAPSIRRINGSWNKRAVIWLESKHKALSFCATASNTISNWYIQKRFISITLRRLRYKTCSSLLCWIILVGKDDSMHYSFSCDE